MTDTVTTGRDRRSSTIVVVTAGVVGPLALITAFILLTRAEPIVLGGVLLALAAILCGCLLIPLSGVPTLVTRWLGSTLLTVLPIALLLQSAPTIWYAVDAAEQPGIVPPGLVSAPAPGSFGPLDYTGTGDATFPFERATESTPVVVRLAFDGSPSGSTGSPARLPPWERQPDDWIGLRSLDVDGDPLGATRNEFDTSLPPGTTYLVIPDPGLVAQLDVHAGARTWTLRVSTLDELPLLESGDTIESPTAGRTDAAGTVGLESSSVRSCRVWHRVDGTWTEADCWTERVELVGDPAIVVLDAGASTLHIGATAS